MAARDPLAIADHCCVRGLFCLRESAGNKARSRYVFDQGIAGDVVAIRNSWVFHGSWGGVGSDEQRPR